MPSRPHRTDWFCDARWGTFTHFLAAPASSNGGAELTAGAWNAQVERFDVEGLAAQLASVGAGYHFLTLGQNSGHYCAPNPTYDRLVGIRPSKCASRDLVADLHDALAPRGIQLLAYLPSGAPEFDPVAVERLRWRKGYDRNAEFQGMWEQVIRDWALRWGTRLSGWWFDGCYHADAMYRNADPPNFASFAAAARAGNPESILAFNPGVTDPIITLTDEEDYAAGEIRDPEPVECTGRWIGGAQCHMLSYLGEWWGRGPARFTGDQVIGWTRRFVEREGVVTWDVPVAEDGHIPQPFLEQLRGLSPGLGGLA